MLIPSARGRQAKAVAIQQIRQLTQEDLALALSPAPVGGGQGTLRALKVRHHHLAKLVAAGENDVSICAMTGFSQSRLSILRNHDPAFQELVAYYAQQAEGKFLDVQERLAGLGTAAIEELAERLEEEPEKFSTKDLLAVAEMTLDRSVAPPKTRAGGTGAPPPITISFVSPAASQQVTISHSPEGFLEQEI